MKLPVACLLAACLTTTALGQGTVLWDESVNGLLSQNYHFPTQLVPVEAGTNSVFATTSVEPVGGNWSVHPDFFILKVPSNLSVKEVTLQIDKSNVWAWLGDATFSTQMAFTGNSSSGDLFSQWQLAALLPGDYGVYLSNNDLQPFTSIAHYRLDFVVQTVPEPGAWTLLLLGAAGWFLQIRRRRSS